MIACHHATFNSDRFRNIGTAKGGIRDLLSRKDGRWRRQTAGTGGEMPLLGNGTGKYSCRSCSIPSHLVGGQKPQGATEKLAKGTINCFGCPPYISKPWCR